MKELNFGEDLCASSSAKMFSLPSTILIYVKSFLPFMIDITPLWIFHTKGTIRDVEISPDKKYIAAVSYDNNLYYFALSGELLWRYQLSDKGRDIAISKNGNILIAGSDDKMIYILSGKGDLLAKYNTDGIIRCVDTSLDGRYSVAGSDDCKIYFFENEKKIWEYKTDGWVGRVAISDDGNFAVAGSVDHFVYLFDKTGKMHWKFKTQGWLESVGITNNGRYIVAGSDDKCVYFLDRTGKLLWKYQCVNPLTCTRISSSGDKIVASVETIVYFLNKSGKMEKQYVTGFDTREADISLNGEVSVAGARNNYVYAFDGKFRLMWKYRCESWVETVDVSSDGRYILAGTQNGTIWVFDNTQIFERYADETKRKIMLFKENGKDTYELEHTIDFCIGKVLTSNYTEAYTLLMKCIRGLDRLGEVIVKKCPNCSRNVEQNWILCPYCGAKLKM